MNRIVLSVVVGMMLLTVTVGTVAGEGSLMCAMGCNCPYSPPATEYLNSPFDDDTKGDSASDSLSSDRSHALSETAIPIHPTNSQYANPSLITYIDELMNLSDPNVVIVDARVPAEYAVGHIPGAINLPWVLFRADNGVLTPLENVTRLLGEAGISQDNRVIVYSDTCQPCGGLSASSYIFWMLEYIGHENVSLLDGGFDAWNATYGCTKNLTTRPPATYTANVMADRFADTEWVQNNLNVSMVQIVDTRTTGDYNADHIKGAINIEYEELFREGERLKGADDLEYLISPVVIKRLDKSKDTVVYCWSGASSSFLYFALRLMGYQVRNYDESWNVWCETNGVLTIPILNVTVDPSVAYKGSAVKIYAEVELRSEMKKESKGSLIVHGDGAAVPYTPDSFCADCSGVYAVPLPTTGVSFVRAYIHKGADVGTTVVMHDYDGDGRYEGEWQTYSAEYGTYYIDIEATDGELETKKENAATVEVAIEAAGP